MLHCILVSIYIFLIFQRLQSNFLRRTVHYMALLFDQLLLFKSYIFNIFRAGSIKLDTINVFAKGIKQYTKIW